VGEGLVERIADAWADAAGPVLENGAPPPPAIFPWVEGLTLGGRLGYSPPRGAV
jgi:hypothetical protein